MPTAWNCARASCKCEATTKLCTSMEETENNNGPENELDKTERQEHVGEFRYSEWTRKELSKATHPTDKQYKKKARTEEEKKRRDKESKRGTEGEQRESRRKENKEQKKDQKEKETNKTKKGKTKQTETDRAGGCGPLRIVTAMMRVETSVNMSNNHYGL